MGEQNKIKKCINCSSELFGQYCYSCGQAQEVKRINGPYILSEIGSVFNFEKGILFTIRELLLRPGVNIRRFIKKDRTRLVRPIIFIIITSLIYTFAQRWFHFEDGYANYSSLNNSAISTIFDWIQQNYGYSNILMAFFIGFWIKILFKKYGFNFFEIIILLCFIMGIGMLLFTIFGIIESLTNIKLLQIGSLIGFAYVSWAIGRFFDKRKKINYLKGFLSYILGMITFLFSAFALGTIIDLAIK